MSVVRKTVEVELLLAKANELLAFNDECTNVPSMLTKEFKEGVCVMIETALHSANRYYGFQFISIENSRVYDSVGYWSRKYF